MILLKIIIYADRVDIFRAEKTIGQFRTEWEFGMNIKGCLRSQSLCQTPDHNANAIGSK